MPIFRRVFALDPDWRELALRLSRNGMLKLDEEKIRRIVFHEITRDAISNAIENPRQIDLNLVNSQHPLYSG
jgi:DNA topoisomerase-1